MSYQVLARRYRSTGFDEVVGQEPIARTLTNAIRQDRTAHAYLFTGTRGVGKTSMARIFAKALNVTDDLEEKDAIAAAILRGDDIDVVEIDAASNRGIDNARDLIANAGLSPARCPYKIYIIDEVHMLTTPAFNALLKTMEEPPAHVKFVLCTTDPHKVPATIQSRCQRFDFRNIPSSRIVAHLAEILERESIDAEERVIVQVARMANGSMRDALSLLDRLLAGAEGKLTGDLLEQMLGLPDQAVVASLVEGIANADASAALHAADALLSHGLSIEQALEALIEHLRQMMLVAACGADDELLDLTAEEREELAAQAQHFDTPALVHMIALCESVARNARGSSTARALFDAAIVRLCLTEQLASIPRLLEGGAPAKKKSLSIPAARPAEAGLAPPRPSAPPPRPVRQVAEVKAVAPEAALPEPGATPPRAPANPPPLAHDELWPAVLHAVARSPADQAMIEPLELVSYDGRLLVLKPRAGAEDSVGLVARNPKHVSDLVRRTTGHSIEVRVDVAADDTPAPRADRSRSVEAAGQIPVIQQAMELFDANVIDAVDAPQPPAAEEKD